MVTHYITDNEAAFSTNILGRFQRESSSVTLLMRKHIITQYSVTDK